MTTTNFIATWRAVMRPSGLPALAADRAHLLGRPCWLPTTGGARILLAGSGLAVLHSTAGGELMANMA